MECGKENAVELDAVCFGMSFPSVCCFLIWDRVAEKINFYPLQMGEVLSLLTIPLWGHGSTFTETFSSLKFSGKEWGIKYSPSQNQVQAEETSYQTSSFIYEHDEAKAEILSGISLETPLLPILFLCFPHHRILTSPSPLGSLVSHSSVFAFTSQRRGHIWVHYGDPIQDWPQIGFVHCLWLKARKKGK